MPKGADLGTSEILSPAVICLRAVVRMRSRIVRPFLVPFTVFILLGCAHTALGQQNGTQEVQEPDEQPSDWSETNRALPPLQL